MSNTSQPLSLPSRLRCGICSKDFTRSEHLKRHELVHSRQRPFSCEQCSKDFFRRDALQRHMSMHQISGPSLVQKGARACLSCAAAKARCSGDLPACQRCQQRAQFPCRYPGLPDNSTGQTSLNGDTIQTGSATNYQDTAHLLRSGNGQQSSALDSQPVLPRNEISGDGGLNQFDQTCWDPSMLSTINWLASDDQMYTFGALMESPDATYPFDLENFVQSPDNEYIRHQAASISVPPMYVTTTHAISEARQGVHSSPGVSQTSVPTPQTLQSASTTGDDGHREGEFYVDGQAARLPRAKRRRLTTTVSPAMVIDTSSGFSLDAVLPVAMSTGSNNDVNLSDEVYQSMVYAFSCVCIESNNHTGVIHDGSHELMEAWERVPSSFFSTYFSRGFPSKAVFEKLVQLYIESIHPLLPIFHETFLNRLSWQLVLVVSAIGARFFPIESVGNFIASLNEFVRRVLLISIENPKWLPSSKLQQAQLRLLHTISCTYAGVRLPKGSKPSISQELADFFFASQSSTTSSTPVSEIQDQWNQWIELEMQRRTSYAIWQLDCMYAIHYQQEAKFKLEDPVVSLPCHESLWAAIASEEWTALSLKYPDIGSLNLALQRLYVEKSLLAVTGEYSRILLIHGLFRRLWEVESYLKHPLSQWTPTAQKQSADALAKNSPIWLPSIPTYAQWRNSACDCLDILHWSANASIGSASGIEHPTVMHLHFARVVLLTPYKQIVALAKHLANVENGERSNLHNQIIRRWALQDQYKARLAMIHAGVLFWHIRRYSANGFYEPASLAIATLALWAFSAFSDRTRRPNEIESNTHEAESNQSVADEEESVCDIILLDRPTDDELVQQFVREGYKMRANMNGVGDLYGKHGPERVLVEGRKLLLTLTSWGDSMSWIRILDGLIKISKQQRLQ